MKKYIHKDNFTYDMQDNKVLGNGWLVELSFLNERTNEIFVPENYEEFCELDKQKDLMMLIRTNL